jgi:hypothetical protein
MKGRWNVWEPWYLMTSDKLGKVECRFCNNVVSCRKDIMFSIWAIDTTMEKLMLQCV